MLEFQPYRRDGVPRNLALAGDVPTDDPCVISKPPLLANSTNSLESVMLLST